MIDRSIRFARVTALHISVSISPLLLFGPGKEIHASLAPPTAARRARGNGARRGRGQARARRSGRAPAARDGPEPRLRDTRRARFAGAAADRRRLPDEPAPGGRG